MKRIAVLLAIAAVATYVVSADESQIIDFNKLVADFPTDKPAQNKATIVDFSSAAGSSFSQADKDKMKTSLAVINWDVKLNSSANSVMNSKDSFTKPVVVKDKATKYAKENVLGVRIRFPVEAWNAVADIRPPFEIPAYQDKTTEDGITVPQGELGKGSKFEGGLGVVKNVGVIKTIRVNVFGNNFPHLLSVLLQDQNGITSEYKMGTLNFDGWHELDYENPNYVTDVRNRDIRVYPLYPTSMPYQKLVGFRIYKDGSVDGGDFVGYIKDVSVVYDKALLTLDRDIDDEATWNILQDREAGRRKAELDRLGNIQVLRMLEKQKMDTGTTATAPAATTTPAATTPAAH